MISQPISLGQQSNPARYGYAGAARLVNCYSEVIGEEGKTPWNLQCVSGLDSFATLADSGAVRAMLAVTDNELYVVAGRRFFRVDASGTATALGGMPTDGMVTMARNREATPRIATVGDGELFYCVGGIYAKYDALPDGCRPISVCHLNGYFSFLDADGRHFASELDGPTISALSFASASSLPDGGVRNWTRGQDLCIGGTESIEFWQDVGASPYPFSRSGSIQVGVLAADAVADVDQTTVFPAHDGTVRILNGYQPEIISNAAVARWIWQQSDPTALSATSWYEFGHSFYALSGSNGTWVWDRSTGKWHERESYGVGRWVGAKTARFANKTVVGDYNTGLLYLLNRETFSEAGQPIVMTVQTPPVTAEPYRLLPAAVRLDVVPGVGDRSGEDPVVMVDWSDDGGANFGAVRHERIGYVGQKPRVISRRLGPFFNRTFRFRCSSSVARCFIQAWLDFQDDVKTIQS